MLLGAAAVVQATRGRREAAAANRAVNHEPIDDEDAQRTINDRVKTIEKVVLVMSEDVNDLKTGLDDCAEVVSRVDTQLTQHLAYHQAETESHRDR